MQFRVTVDSISCSQLFQAVPRNMLPVVSAPRVVSVPHNMLPVVSVLRIMLPVCCFRHAVPRNC